MSWTSTAVVAGGLAASLVCSPWFKLRQFQWHFFLFSLKCTITVQTSNDNFDFLGS